MRRVGVLIPLSANDPQAQVRNAAFLQGLQQFGWTVGNDVQIDYRWSAGNEDDTRKYALELVALAPDVIFAAGSGAVGQLQRATRTVPIVFALAIDPVGAGFVDNLARPGGNITGFAPFEYSLGGKWLEVLKEIAPNLTRVAVVRDPAITAGIGLAAIQSVAPSFGRLTPGRCARRWRDRARADRLRRQPERRSDRDRERASGRASRSDHRACRTAPATAVYYDRYFTAAGGLISYGSNIVEEYRLAAGYVDRILKGEKPAELPVQAATKYELVINLKTAKALGLEIPADALLVRADEVIE